MQSGKFKPLIWVVLLGFAFFSGVAWKNASTKEANETNNTPTPVPSNQNQPTLSEDDIAALTAAEKATIKLFEQASPSVCFITTTNLRTNWFTQDVTEIQRGSGSGFVWDNDGHVVTNYHVIEGADRAKVTIGEQTYNAALIGIAPDKDLAVLRIDEKASNLRPIPIGSSASLRVGQSVYAIGNPFGLDYTLTTGILSALDREIESVSGIPIREVLQTDAAINPGNSGGPLLDSSGRLIGVNTAIYSPSGASAGIGFSIPVDAVKWVIPQLIEFGELKRPTIGIEAVPQQFVNSRLGLKGVLIRNTIKGGPAQKADLQSTYVDNNGRLKLGDLIVGLNDNKVESLNDLRLALEKYEPGQTVTLAIIRNEKKQEVEITLAKAK